MEPPTLILLTMAELFPDRPCIYWVIVNVIREKTHSKLKMVGIIINPVKVTYEEIYSNDCS